MSEIYCFNPSATQNFLRRPIIVADKGRGGGAGGGGQLQLGLGGKASKFFLDPSRLAITAFLQSKDLN